MNEVNERITEPGQNTLTYNSYLKVDELLRLQQTLASPPQHDELLFIIIHQVYELWFKQILAEIAEVTTAVKQDQSMRLLKAIKRITTIQNTLIQQIDVLETMTPNDFNLFRDRLNPASGFQSHQFRIVEFKLGMKEAGYLKFFKHQPFALTELTRAFEEPTVYDEVLKLMARKGFAIPAEVLQRDYKEPHRSHPDVVKVMAEIYRDSQRHGEMYILLEALLDIDEKFEIWRYRHITMVKRMIGTRMGTGGSTGAQYLSTTLTKRAFPEIWESRNFLGDGTNPQKGGY
jgi:tryptophan 2,3-dioxygenase